MNETRKGVRQNGRTNCYFCGSEGPIETHHIVPQRHGGEDMNENLVDLCPTCHERLERLYTDMTDHGMPVWELHWKVYNAGYTHEEFGHAVEKLKHLGDTYEPKLGYLRTT